METLTLDKKKFVVIEQDKFDKLQLLAAKKKPHLAQATLQIIKLLLAQGCRAGNMRWQSLCP